MPPIIVHRNTLTTGDRMPFTDFTIKYKDVFSLEYLYLLMHEWLVIEGYADRDDPKFPETFYLQRESPGGKEVWFRWRPTKVPPEDRSGLWRYEFDIDAHVLGLNQVELIKDGKKIKADKGEIEIKSSVYLVFAYDQAWKNHPLWRKHKEWIKTTLLKNKFNFHKAQITEESRRFQEAIKTYLRMPLHLTPLTELAELWEKKPE